MIDDAYAEFWRALDAPPACPIPPAPPPDAYASFADAADD